MNSYCRLKVNNIILEKLQILRVSEKYLFLLPPGFITTETSPIYPSMSSVLVNNHADEEESMRKERAASNVFPWHKSVKTALWDILGPVMVAKKGMSGL